MRLAESSIHHYHLPYDRPVHWFNSSEAGANFVLLRLVGDDGSVGVGEATIKPTWSGTSVRSVVAVLEDLLLPALQATDITDAAAVSQSMGRFPENTLAKTLIANACHTLRSAATGKPAWQLAGGSRSVDLSWCVTRQAPPAMAAEAARMVDRFGFRALKVKGGQGIDTDLRALREITKAVGTDVAFYVDTNAAYPLDPSGDYIRAIA
uniref:enolase C-terminal domain-like protein n=1 Tax=Acidisphaera sp. L21 TaxID=1641851 RepID=UPI001C208E7E